MSKFMRQQFRIQYGQLGVRDTLFLDAVVARLMMLQTLLANHVAQAEKKMVGLVMTGGVKWDRFPHQLVQRGEILRLQVDVLSGVTGYVEVVLGRDLRSDWNLAKISACDHWRIYQLLDGNGRKGCHHTLL